MDLSKATTGIKKLLAGDAKVKIVVALGLVGMALILLSQLFSPGRQAPKEIDTATAQFTSESYITDLEAKLTSLISGMEGVGEARVMVTLESGVEYIYAQEQKRNTDITQEGGAAEAARTYEKENIEQKYILVETQNGKKQPLLQTERQPKVQGVVIVCQGADDILVEQALTNVVTTALNIPTTRVCVVKIGAQSQKIMQEETQ